MALIEARLVRIEWHAHFGDTKDIDQKIAELRWKNGLRVYFSRIAPTTILILIAGEKYDQKKCIKKATLLIQDYADSSPKT